MVLSNVELYPVPENETARFKPRERQVVSLLAKANGQIVSKENLWHNVYAHLPESSWPDTDTIKVFISMARRKLRHHNIVSYRGYGYKLEPRLHN